MREGSTVCDGGRKFRMPSSPIASLFSGSGPGVQAPDGCSVELYRALPYLGELDDILERIPPGAAVLELGCGPGRLTRVLLARGCAVDAVDNSPEMLAGLPAGATPHCAGIESLALDAAFDVALLASGLVNHPDRALRAAFLATARRHLRPGGRLFVQRHDPAWLRSAPAGTVRGAGNLRIEVETVERAGDRVAMTIRYGDAGAHAWRHSFVAEALDDAAIERALADAGFAPAAWLGARRRWIEARTLASRSG